MASTKSEQSNPMGSARFGPALLGVGSTLIALVLGQRGIARQGTLGQSTVFAALAMFTWVITLAVLGWIRPREKYRRSPKTVIVLMALLLSGIAALMALAIGLVMHT